jgi:hypothetical protein
MRPNDFRHLLMVGTLRCGVRARIAGAMLAVERSITPIPRAFHDRQRLAGLETRDTAGSEGRAILRESWHNFLFGNFDIIRFP